jgi:hypothetical protein
MKKILYIIAVLSSFNLCARPLEEAVKPIEIIQTNRINNADVTFQLPRFIFTYTNTRIIVKFTNPNNLKLVNNNYELDLIVNGTNQKVVFDNNGIGNLYYTFKNNNSLQILIEDVNYSVQPSVISIWYIVSPLIITILFFAYRIAATVKKNKTPRLIVKRNLESTETEIRMYPSTLKVVRVKEEVEEF